MEHVVVEQFVKNLPQLDAIHQFAAGVLVRVADRLRAERVFVRIQVGIVEKNTHSLVKCADLIFTDAADLGRHLIEVDCFIPVVIRHQRDLVR